MAGIGSGAAPGAPMQGQQQMPPRDVADPSEGQPNVSPEEQAQYDHFVGNAQELIYGDGEDGQPRVEPAVLAQLRGEMDQEVQGVFANVEPPLSGSPTDNLAAATVMVVLVLEGTAASEGTQLDDAVVLHGGTEILSDLAEIAEAARIHAYTQEEIEAATYRAMDMYRTTSGRVDQEALKAQFGEIVAADKAGTLDQLLPGISSRMPQGGAR